MKKIYGWAVVNKEFENIGLATANLYAIYNKREVAIEQTIRPQDWVIIKVLITPIKRKRKKEVVYLYDKNRNLKKKYLRRIPIKRKKR